MAEIKKSDFIYFQNEVLQDIKKLDIKFTEQLGQLIKSFQNDKLITDQKFVIINDKISSILSSLEANIEYQKLKTEIDNFKKHINQEQLTNSNKIYSLEKDLSEISFKYDNLFSSVLGAPGLIGKGCKYSDMKSFYELTDKKIVELLNFKEKKNMDFEKYKNKLESLIGQFKLQINNSQNKYFSFCNEKILETKNKIDDQFNFIDEKINNMRMDNGKYSFDLIQKSEELSNKIKTLNNITNEVDNKLKEEMDKYIKQNHELLKIFESQREEFKIIKVRFTELSEYIKDIRFAKNIKNYAKGNNNKEFKSSEFWKKSKLLSKKLNFDKPQKIEEEDLTKYLNNYKNEDNNNIINDNNSINNNDNINKKENNKKDKEKKGNYNIKININDSNSNTNNNTNINFNSTFNNNLNITKNNNIINNNYTINSSVKANNYNSFKSVNKSRNLNNLYNEGIKNGNNSNKNNIYLKTEDSLHQTINQKKHRNLFIRTQSQFCFNNQNIKPELKLKIQKTQNNFYNKKNIENIKVNNNNPKSSRGQSYNVIRKYKKIFDKEEKLDYQELLKALENNDINDINNNTIHIEAYKYLNNNILNIEEKINRLNNMTKFNFEKLYKKLQIYLDLTNTLLMKIKIDKMKSMSKNLNSPVKLYTASEINIPPLNSKNNNKDLTERNKIKPKNLENSTLFNIKDKHKTISSSKILSVIEPYLIKKFKSNS